jgi:hypothetical protein
MKKKIFFAYVINYLVSPKMTDPRTISTQQIPITETRNTIIHDVPVPITEQTLNNVEKMLSDSRIAELREKGIRAEMVFATIINFQIL